MTALQIDPIAFHIGSFPIRWYGLMYLLGFAFAYFLARSRRNKYGYDWTLEEINDLIIYGALGVLIGGRFGYIIFYDFASLAMDPLRFLRLWEGGMSFHGGLIGVIIAMYLFAKNRFKGFFQVTDFVAPLVPLGLGAGRIANFINSELWGRVSDVPWAISPYPGALARHPSQLYEAFLEGLVLFVIMWWYSSKLHARRKVSGMFLFCYGIIRFFVEFFRMPDEHLGFLAFEWLTMGQLLSVPMILLGAWWLLASKEKSGVADT